MAYQYHGNVLIELVSHLEDNNMFSSRRIREAMLYVPRADFLPPDYQDHAYEDKPLKISEFGFNVSAPHMYAHCLESLSIETGHTVLDVGSGCGHFTGIAGYLTGDKGKVLGIDINPDAVEFAKANVEKLKSKGMYLPVRFENRNVFIPDMENRKWDRIHVGASCPNSKKHELYELLAPGGILVAPIKRGHLIKATKDIHGHTREEVLMDVRYGSLVMPSKKEVRNALKRRITLPQPSIENDYVKMVNNKFLSDVQFSVEGKILYAHKIVLASRCEYFTNLYRSGMKDSNAQEIEINDYCYDSFSQFLNYIYTGTCEIANIPIASELMRASDYYKLDGLKAQCEMILCKAMNYENVCTIWEVSCQYNAFQLRQISQNFVAENYEHIKESQGFQELHRDRLKECLNTVYEMRSSSSTSFR
eukprot:TRINITY_DN358_c0_g1_i2.p1 TRINITY_DN358_c0_g1~~TRINITY_DN358_c0_g1_i2.p1  ORF type:complete len:419 (-),score=64.39 TRINITY_DN358_c0_g1_i2:167-1423(-)